MVHPKNSLSRIECLFIPIPIEPQTVGNRKHIILYFLNAAYFIGKLLRVFKGWRTLSYLLIRFNLLIYQYGHLFSGRLALFLHHHELYQKNKI